MERKYYEIDEKSAVQAYGTGDRNKYVEGFKTEEYREYVDSAYELADKAAAGNPDRAGDVYALADEYAKKLADNFNRDIRIYMECPSPLAISPTEPPVKKKERQRRAAEYNRYEIFEIHKCLEKINAILLEIEAVKSRDAWVAGKLQDKLEWLRKECQKMKEVNAYYQKNKKLDGCPALTQAEIGRLKEKMKSGSQYQGMPYRSCEFCSNNQNIRAVKDVFGMLSEMK